MDARVSDIEELLAKGEAASAFSQGLRLANEFPDHPQLTLLVGNAALQSGDYTQAVKFFSKADELHPDAAGIKNNLGAALLHSGDPAAAVAALKQAVTLKPDYGSAKINLATAYKGLRRYAEAESQLADVRNLTGDTVEIVSELADLYRLQERWEEAADAYQALLEIDPADVGLREMAVNALVQSGDVRGAVQVASTALPHGDQRGNALACYGDIFLKNGNKFIAERFFRDAIGVDPTITVARMGLSDIYRRDVARWHFSMLNDVARNEAYDAAIRRAVKPGDIVLDIGTGSGLLAMMAARAGAAHVYTCESVPVIAAKAGEIIEANGFADKITVLSKWSHELVVGQDLPAPADVLVSEIVDNLLIGEGIMAALDHALGYMVKDDARILPSAGRINVVPVECERLFWRDRCDHSVGFDVSAFGDFTRFGNYSSDMVRADDYRELGETEQAFSFDFTRSGFSPDRNELRLACIQSGTLHGVMVWFELVIDESECINNHPERGREHWGCSFCFLDRPRPVEAGETVELCVDHDTTTIDFRFS